MRKTEVRLSPDEGFILVGDGTITAEMWAKRIDDALIGYAAEIRRELEKWVDGPVTPSSTPKGLI